LNYYTVKTFCSHVFFFGSFNRNSPTRRLDLDRYW